MKEKIICSTLNHKGTIICGLRHKDCYKILCSLLGDEIELPERKEQGFLTSLNRFVDRKEAYKIAFENNQIIGVNKEYESSDIGLTSEDLFGFCDE